MLNSGTIALTWEPYTGGKASPNPDYPQEIESIGDDGEVGVTVSGGNLLKPIGDFPITSSGITLSLNEDGSIHVQGTATATGNIRLVNPIIEEYSVNLSSATLSLSIISGDFNGIVNICNAESLTNWLTMLSVNSNRLTSTGTVKTSKLGCYITYTEGVYVDYTIKVMLNAGSTALPYEPYKTHQTLTVSTPNGLPGIPVSSGGNYTDADGQQWVCDEIDLARGKYVQRVDTYLIDTCRDKIDNSRQRDPEYFGVECDTAALFIGYSYFCLSNKLVYAGNNSSINGSQFTVITTNGITVFGLKKSLVSEETTVAVRQYLSENPIEIIYVLLEPIETDLPAEEIAAYQSIHTYKPTTTITNDANTYMEVSYVKDIEQVINNTVNETVESAIDDYDTEIKSFVDTNYVKKTDLDTEQEKLEKYIESYYAMRRNGKVYQTKLWKFATNPTSDGEKLLSNAGLVFEPSTDTDEGQDDYLNGQHPMFEWVNVNYVRDNDGTARPTAIEGMDNYATSGSVDVGTMQMSFYWKWDSSNAEYDLITVSDSPHPELGLEPWPECVKEDGTVLPWCIGSKYISGIASDGLLRSQPGLKPERKQSHNNMITNYAKKGEGYFGAGAVRNLFQIVFNIIKGATKSSQTLYQGVTNWNFQYDASVESATSNTYFPVTNSQAENLIVGNYVSVGYGYYNSGELGKDRSTDSLHAYADDVKILSIETLDENNKAVYLDIETGFNTTPVQVTDSLTSPIIMSSMHAWSGMTDSVIGKHDGSPISNTNSKMPYRVQGREYAVGGYIIASDTVMDLQGDFTKNVYVAEKGTARSSLDSTIRSTYKMVGTIPAAAAGNNADWWIGDIAVDMNTGVWYPSVEGSSSSQGMADRCYAGGSTATSGTREYLQGGDLGHGLVAGSAFLICGSRLSWTYWACLGCD